MNDICRTTSYTFLNLVLFLVIWQRKHLLSCDFGKKFSADKERSPRGHPYILLIQHEKCVHAPACHVKSWPEQKEKTNVSHIISRQNKLVLSDEILHLLAK